ncbi:hypothetical protein ACET3Z_003465 [Daucus carota]
MARLGLFLVFYAVAAVGVPVFSGASEQPKEVENWFGKLGQYKQKVTKLHFYFHDLRGKTSVLVAQANSSATSPTYFGMTNIMDDPLTAGPEFTSKPVGRAQGLYSTSSMEELSLVCAMNFIFTDDKYNGSTITIFGNNPILQQRRELPVIGGTGVFRMARGVAMLNTIYFDVAGGNATPEDVKKWLEQRENHKAKITKLHFYFHELRERTSTLVAQANSSATSPTFFGVTYVMDDPLTAGPEFTSEPVGRAQGLYASASKEEAGLVCVFNFVFTNDKYNGSSLSIFGYNPTLRQSRELVVVGGTGVFRMARGVAVLSFVYFDVAGGNATVEYNVIVEHY